MAVCMRYFVRVHACCVYNADPSHKPQPVFANTHVTSSVHLSEILEASALTMISPWQLSILGALHVLSTKKRVCY